MNNSYLLFRNIKDARMHAGFSQIQLARKIGVSNKTISAYETGRAIPPTVVLFSIAKVTGISLLQLTGFEQKLPENNISKKMDSLTQMVFDIREQTRKSMDVFVGSVLLDKNNNIYLIKENDKNKIGKNRWNLPGGSVDENESIIQAIIRETKEETGYSSNIISQVGCYKCKKEDHYWVYIVFSAKIKENGHEKVDTKEKEVKIGKWFSRDEFLKIPISKLVHPDMRLVYSIAVNNGGLLTDSIKFIDYT